MVRSHNDPPLPVTVIGGYLGAGKTTLVNHLLRNADGRRLAVLVNEFGSLPIDEDLIKARDDTMISIAGGCVCCSYGSDMMGALQDLSRLAPRPDHILLEASGVALPDAVAQSVGLLEACRLDATVVIADAETVQARAADTYLADTIIRQLQAADIIVLNKADLIGKPAETDLHLWLSQIANEARVLSTIQAAVTPEAVIDSADAAGNGIQGHHAARTGSGSAVTHHSASFKLTRPVDARDLAGRLAAPALGLVRAKGMVPDRDGTMRTLQVVGRRWQVLDSPDGYTGDGGFVCIRVETEVDREAVDQAIQQAASVIDSAAERSSGQQADQMA